MRRAVWLAAGLVGVGCERNYGDGRVDLPLPDMLVPREPTAVCSVSPSLVTPPFEAATWTGSESFDAWGLPITEYQWELLSAPEGNEAALSGNGPTVAGFTPQLAGEYVGRLTVTNEIGESSACEATLTAVPNQELWVEMYWEHSGDDMDLHLLAPGGVTQTDSDCYFANCVDWGYGGLDWGVQGETADDPALDLDDIPGTGPEGISLGWPQHGTYTVVVHDYPGSVYSEGNNVTISIYVGGTLEWSDTRTITTEDSYTPFAQIDWTPRTVTGL